jgi:hypothetical protein
MRKKVEFEQFLGIDPILVCLSRKGSKKQSLDPAHLPTPHSLPTLLCFGAARVLGYSHQVPGPPFFFYI